MSKRYLYPDVDDEDILSSLYKKREFYYYKVNPRKKLETYDEIKQYRDVNCTIDKDPREQQIILPYFINPNTPYRGLLIMHGVGSGKTMTAIRIAEQFKDQVKKYNTKIYILVPGPNTKENFKKELLTSTGNTYLKNKELLSQMTKEEVEIEKKQAIALAMNYYKIMSHRTFYKKVLGEKIVEKKVVTGNKIKVSYKKNKAGEYEREQIIDRIINMNNSILIIDEAHNLTGNEYGLALTHIIKNSQNLKIILLTATPMINFADEIIDLLNYIRPDSDKIKRDKIFTTDKSYNMSLKPSGLEYLKMKAKGYISFYRGSVPYTFATRIDKGIIPSGLLFTPVIRCKMLDFQYNVYTETIKNFDDTLDKASSAASNFIFPVLSKDKQKLIGKYSNDGLQTILSQLSLDGPLLKKMINTTLFNNMFTPEEENNLIYDNGKKNITGTILKMPYIQVISTKFYTILKNIEKLVETETTKPEIAFIYSNLVKAGGIELLGETMLQNGYLEYSENFKSYDIKDNTIDYRTGLTYLEYKKSNNIISLFRPATFLLITGNSDKDEQLPEYKQKIIQTVFNSKENIDGKYIKFILGSRVMNEGVTLQNCKEVHILDVFYNIPKVEQAIGRAIRMCVHQDVISESNKFPEVNIYRYVVTIASDEFPDKLSNEEILYQKAELKYLTIKEVERGLKEVAIDCPLLLHMNMFPEEIEKFKGCVPPTIENIKKNKLICPALCDFKECNIKCDAPSLNKKYWNENNNEYDKLNKDEVDYSTFNEKLAVHEIDSIKLKIKDLYLFKHVYEYLEIVDSIKNSYTLHQQDFFNSYFINRALLEMMPKDENEFNNFKDIIYDKYDRPGYLIKRNKYYIFQPFNENENISISYREEINIPTFGYVSLKKFIQEKYPDLLKEELHKTVSSLELYDFDSVIEYYNNKRENFVVGIIDNKLNKKTNIIYDIFKIRAKRHENKLKKGIGIPSLKGCVCTTFRSRSQLLKIYNKLANKQLDSNYKKDDLCEMIKNKLLELEKYATEQNNNKVTYIMIPANHPLYKFPYNLEDRVSYIKQKINQLIPTINITVVTKKVANNKIYELSFTNNKDYESFYNDFIKLDFKLDNKEWKQTVD